MDLWRFFADDPSSPAEEPAGGPTREELDALFALPETGIEMTIPPPIAVNVEEED